MPQRSRLVIGCGYVGQPLAAAWHAVGSTVYVTTRSQDRFRHFENQGWKPVLADVTNPQTLRHLPEVDTVVVSVGFDPAAGHSREEVFFQGFRNVLEALPQVRRLILVSTTGVYGDAGGEVVDEQTPCEPAREGGKAFLKAETYLKEHPVWSSRSVILRMAGIYGPGRIPRMADIQAGKPIPSPGGGALNLIHVDDAVTAIQLAADAEQVSPVYIVSDGHPTERRDYYREVARLLDAPEPTFDEPDPNSPAALRAQSDRRMSNQRLVEELGFQPKYPSYREGLFKIIGPQ